MSEATSSAPGLPAARQAGAHEEFERQPVPKSHWKGLTSFLALYAGEHVAGTEFMIGPLFVAAGVSAADLVLGLLAGNVLAVLSWLLICAPAATRARLTLYCKLQKVCGPNLVAVYNLANGLLFCILAGAMVSVSATAVGVPLKLVMPTLSDWLPNSWTWVVIVLVVGALFAYVAAQGYDAMSKVAVLVTPGMVLAFLACGVAALPDLGIASWKDFWETAQTTIWKGGDPLPGQPKFTFWHVMFFAWTCNAATHLGLVDMAIFRYARKWTYGAASAVGMFIGHFLAWIAASLLFARQLHLDPGNMTVSPGMMAYQALGVAGILCVLLAGWTTANPTLYRAGLAFQALRPASSRFKLTLVAGAIAAVAAIFPALVMKLLDFVGFYGTILMPMGAVVFADLFLLPKLGLPEDFAERYQIKSNPAAGLAWLLTLAACGALNLLAGVPIYFLAVPGWIIALALYLVLARIYYPRRMP